MSQPASPPARRLSIRGKRKPRDPLLVYLSKALFATLLLILVGFLFLSRFNISIDPQYYAGIESSLPWAVWITDTANTDVTYGDYVAFETDARMLPHFRPGTKFVKEVIGLPGDHILIDDGIVTVNEVFVGTINLSLELGRTIDSFNRDMVVKPGHFWVMGTSPISYDSRYWGTIDAPQIVGESWHLWPLFAGSES